jgi:hypothetical protein
LLSIYFAFQLITPKLKHNLTLYFPQSFKVCWLQILSSTMSSFFCTGEYFDRLVLLKSTVSSTQMQIAMPCTRLAPREDIINHVPGKELSFREQKSLFTIDGSLYALAREDERCVPIVMVGSQLPTASSKRPLHPGIITIQCYFPRTAERCPQPN